MSIMTVQGKINKDKLGVVLPHEHVYIDLRSLVEGPQDISRKKLYSERIEMGNLGILSRNPYAILDNAVLDDEKQAEEEIMEFKKAGGDTIVDLTLAGIGRDPVLLYRISRALGLNIVAGCGYYINSAHPNDMEKKTVESIAEEILNDLTIGIDGTNIKAGVIGEIGTSETIYPNEIKVLKAAAVAQRETNAGIHVHTYLWGTNGMEVIRILIENGVPPNKICIDHIDVELNMPYLKELINMGVFIEFDNFGKEYYIDRKNRSLLKGNFARDSERVLAIKHLSDCGYISSILISVDVCLKTLTHKYGGWGYDHILTNILPMMQDYGITMEQIYKLVRTNPATFLDDGYSWE